MADDEPSVAPAVDGRASAQPSRPALVSLCFRHLASLRDLAAANEARAVAGGALSACGREEAQRSCQLSRRARLARPYLESLELPPSEACVGAVALLSASLERARSAARECGRGALYRTLNHAGIGERLNTAWRALGAALRELGVETTLSEMDEHVLKDKGHKSGEFAFGGLEAAFRKGLMSPQKFVDDLIRSERISLKELAECHGELLELQSELQHSDRHAEGEEGQQKREQEETYLSQIIAHLATVCPAPQEIAAKVGPLVYLCKVCVHSSKRRLQVTEKYFRTGVTQPTAVAQTLASLSKEYPKRLPSVGKVRDSTGGVRLTSLPGTHGGSADHTARSTGRLGVETVAVASATPPEPSRGKAVVLPEDKDPSIARAGPDLGAGESTLDWEQKASKFREDAQQGDAEAQYRLAFCYQQGKGVAKDSRESVRFYRMSAEQGHARAQHSLATLLQSKEGATAQNLRESVLWFRRSANQGFAPAQHAFGICLQGYPGHVAPTPKYAVEWFRRAADQGHAAAQCEVAHCYYRGSGGMSKDIQKAIALYRKAAAQGHAKAQFYLGRCYLTGEGVAADLERGVAWYRKSAAQGDLEAQKQLAFYLLAGFGAPRDPVEAVGWLRKSAEQGDAIAQYTLRGFLETGQGVPVDLEEATVWFRKSAEHGYAAGQYHLGQFLRRRGAAAGSSKDLCEGAVLLQKAAEQGDDNAQCELGFCYEVGEGVAKACKRAVAWYRRSVAQGNVGAKCRLATCLQKGEGVARDLREAAELLREAAETGDKVAQYNMAVCLEKGMGVAADQKAAVAWYRKAANNGVAEAQVNLAICLLAGEGVAQDLAEAMVWYGRAAEQGNEVAKEALHLLEVAKEAFHLLKMAV